MYLKLLSFSLFSSESLPSYMIIIGAVLSVIAFPLNVISLEFRMLFVLAASLSLIGLSLEVVRSRAISVNLPILSVVFLLILVGISLLQVDELAENTLFQYIGYLTRMLPALILFYIYPSFGLNINFFSKLAVILFWTGIIVIVFNYVMGLVYENGLIEYAVDLNTENSIGGMFVSLIPLFLLKKKYFLIILPSIFILYGDGRMVQLVLAIIFVVWIMSKYIPKSSLVYLFSIISIGVPLLIISVKFDIFFPSKFLFYPEPEWVRVAMSLVTNNAISDHFITGIGFGEICKITDEISSRCIIPHGAHSFYWAQAGLFAYALFLILSMMSIFRPLSLFVRSNDGFYFAISLVNLAGFLIFLTRPHYDSTVYNLFWVLGISLTYIYLPKSMASSQEKANLL